MKKNQAGTPSIIRQIRILPSIILAVSVLVVSSILWLVEEHKKANDLAINFHATSVQNIGQIRYELSALRNQLIGVSKLGNSLLDNAAILSKQHKMTKSLYIIEQKSKNIRRLQEKYKYISFLSNLERFEAHLQPLLLLLTTEKPSKLLAMTDLLINIDAIMLSLLQLERLHEITNKKLTEEEEDKEQFYLVIIFLVLLGVIISVLVFKRIYGSIKNLLQEQKETEDLLEQGLSVANDGVWDWHLDTDAVSFDDRFYTLSGYAPKEFPFELNQWKKRIHPDDLERVSADIELYLSGGSVSYDAEYRFLSKLGNYMWVRGRGKISKYDDGGQPIRLIGTHSDVTDKKNAEKIILHQAHFDLLTDLPNRFLSLDRLSQLINDARRNNKLVAVLFLDLDDFKKINDSLGHEAGDKLLVDTSKRLSRAVRNRDTVGRLGGDEFIILLEGITKVRDISPIAEKLISQFRKAFSIDGHELIMTSSVGIAVFPENGENASLLLQNADSAMYHAKEKGRNTYSYFTDAMNLEVSRRFALEEQMHEALERGEFDVFYQPQVDVTSGHILGAEALLRWHNPTLGNITPDEFIPIAEQTGAIIPLGKFVLEEALKNTVHWQQNSFPAFRIAVNLSPRQFRDPELVTQVKKSVARFNIPLESLELEITEGVLMSGHNYIDEALTALSHLGISIAMDDFGTGYSSLSYLRNYPFNVLKIDRSFVNDITNNSSDRELINAAIAMAHGLNLKVVAEGVERKEQLAILKTMGCDFAQGYLFGKPMPAEDMTAMLNSFANQTEIQPEERKAGINNIN